MMTGVETKAEREPTYDTTLYFKTTMTAMRGNYGNISFCIILNYVHIYIYIRIKCNVVRCSTVQCQQHNVILQLDVHFIAVHIPGFSVTAPWAFIWFLDGNENKADISIVGTNGNFFSHKAHGVLRRMGAVTEIPGTTACPFNSDNAVSINQSTLLHIQSFYSI